MKAFAARRGPDIQLLTLALAATALATLRWSALGDYPNDAGPALWALLHGHVHAFLVARPAMGSLSLYARAPFDALAGTAKVTPLSIYRWGALPCVASVGLLGLWLARVAGRRGTTRLGQVAIVLVAVLNPLVHSALASGHPEELMTASLSVGALAAARLERAILATVLLGLALCCKQWAVVAVLPVLLSLPQHRLRALGGAAAIAVTATLPMLIASPGVFIANQLALAHEHYLEPAVNSWLWLIAPSVTKHLVLSGQPVVVHVAHLSPAVVGLLHPLMIALAIGLAAGVWWRRGALSLTDACAVTALIFLLRCTLDTETMPYYHGALLLTLLAWDALRGERIPIRALAAAAVAFMLFDRLSPQLSARGSSLLYAACSLAIVLWLGYILLDHRRGPARDWARGRRAPALDPGTLAHT